jgi:hypothetical protein
MTGSLSHRPEAQWNEMWENTRILNQGKKRGKKKKKLFKW